ncbi:MAG TPA: barstar family protein [Thauera aminoaromatica]|nr:barstar family protein [Thauera aminoaromatica]
MSHTSHAPAAQPTPPLRIDLAGCTDKAGVLARIATALHFPEWFGHNWDALSDCLCDLSWLPAAAYRLEFLHADALRATAPETFATLCEILDEAGDFWRAEGVGFGHTFIPALPEAPSGAPR